MKAMATQRSHSIEFKRQVAQEFIAGESLYALSKRHDISRQLIRVWVQKYEAGALDEDAQAAVSLRGRGSVDHWHRACEYVHGTANRQSGPIRPSHGAMHMAGGWSRVRGREPRAAGGVVDRRPISARHRLLEPARLASPSL